MNKGYMLTRVYEKKCTHEGIRTVSRPNGLSDIIEYVVVHFEPKVISEVDEEIDMSAPVDAGFIIEVGCKVEPIVEVLDCSLAKDCVVLAHGLIEDDFLSELEVVVEDAEPAIMERDIECANGELFQGIKALDDEELDSLKGNDELKFTEEECVDSEIHEALNDWEGWGEKEPVEPVEDEPEVEEHGDDEPLEVEVGIMVATVDPGEDGELNTDDDIVEISRKVEEEDEVEVEDEDEVDEEEDEPEDEDDEEELIEDEDEEEEEEEESSDLGYEKLGDGSFLCLKCKSEGEEKILKTELGMIKHIQDKH